MKDDIYNQSDSMVKDEDVEPTNICIKFKKKGSWAISHRKTISYKMGDIINDIPEHIAEKMVARGDGEYHIPGMLSELPVEQDAAEPTENLSDAIESYRVSLAKSFEGLSAQLIEQSQAHSEALSAIQSDIQSLAQFIEQPSPVLDLKTDPVDRKESFFSRLFKFK